MSDDIRFYGFNFKLLYILPPYSSLGKNGYISQNTTEEFNGTGSLELIFVDDELKKIVENNKDALFIVWRDFQGFITSYKWDTQCRITGMHLNGLLHRIVIPPVKYTAEESTTKSVCDIITDNITANASWIFKGNVCSSSKVEYVTEKPLPADEFITGVSKPNSIGFKVRADVSGKKFYLDLKKSSENDLILSEQNLNAYDFEQTYINKSKASSGWYNKKDTGWTHITSTGAESNSYKSHSINHIATVLSSTTKEDALQELKSLVSEMEIVLKTRNVQHGIDYNIGDFVKVQKDGIMEKRLVGGVNMWNEGTYGEQPILEETEM